LVERSLKVLNINFATIFATIGLKVIAVSCANNKSWDIINTIDAKKLFLKSKFALFHSWKLTSLFDYWVSKALQPTVCIAEVGGIRIPSDPL
jgi:hypothetical protein